MPSKKQLLLQKIHIHVPFKQNFEIVAAFKVPITTFFNSCHKSNPIYLSVPSYHVGMRRQQ